MKGVEVETVLTCPLGHKCEEVRDGKIYRCTWLTQLAGQNPNTGEKTDEKGCAMVWLPVLLIENSMQQRRTSAAVESFRNEVAATQNILAAPHNLKQLIEASHVLRPN